MHKSVLPLLLLPAAILGATLPAAASALLHPASPLSLYYRTAHRVASTTTPTQPPERPQQPEKPQSNKAVLQQLKTNQARWRSHQIQTYEYVYQRSCFCLPDARVPAKITVKDGAIATVVNAETGEAIKPEFQELYQVSVEDLFAKVQAAIDQNADQITVDYHPEHGYPTKVAIDYDFGMADEEMYFEAKDLAVPNP